jgi:hypothetical protein
MSSRSFATTSRVGQVVAIVLIAGTCGPRPLRAEIEFEATWQPPTYAAVRGEVETWLAASDADREAESAVRKLWPEAADDSGKTDLLDRVAASLAAVEPRAAELLAACQANYLGPEPPDAKWLVAADNTPPAFVANNLRLYYARWLAQFGLFDEVLAALDGLRPADVVDPASLLFYRTVAHQQLVQPDEARAALVQLLEHREQLPQRYQQLAQLLERDLSSFSDESLDHIARRMNDIRRRLNYGRAGERVQAIERSVVESLDEKIKQLEEQQKRQSAMAQANGQSTPSNPAQDSMLPTMQAPMQVDQKDIGNKAGWGDLPPRERERAMQQIGRDFPAHYRDLIEQYFRELAAETDAP